jgi:hypothetical protein
MVKNYLDIFFEKHFECLNKSLKPLTIGHLLLLSKFGLVWSMDNKETTDIKFHDIIMAIIICSKSYKEFAKFYNKKWSFKFQYWLLKVRFNKINADKVVDTLQEYFKYYLENCPKTTPVVKPGQAPEKPIDYGSPFLLVIISTLLTTYHWRPDEIFDTPINLVLWLLVCKAELDGKAVITSEVDTKNFESAIEFVKELRSDPDKLKQEIERINNLLKK